MVDDKVKNCLGKYKSPELAKRDINNAIQMYKGLICKCDIFTFNDGSCMELINLDGTIPVQFRKNFYNIPVCIWLMDTHPNHAPLCFVKPTPDMSIKISKYVDNNGRIYLPYLHEWKADKSDLLCLVQCMILAFGELPPVYARPPGEVRTTPPYPTASYMPRPNVYPTQDYMPYPTHSNAMPTPNNPYPAYQPYSPPYPQAAYPTPYPPANSNMPFPMPPSDNMGTSDTGTIRDEHIKLSLRSAVEDKIRRRMNEQYQQNRAEIDTLQRTQQELNDGKNRLNDILQRLEKENDELDKNISILREKEQELKDSIEKLSGQEEINPDDAVTTTTPLYNQLLKAFAEEATTEDAIYYMGEALRKGVIDLDTFLKQVRALSGKQFTLRVLMQKCRQKAGLAC